jgi:hypothetical protein
VRVPWVVWFAALLVLNALGPACPASGGDALEEMLGDVEQEEDYLELLNLLDGALRQPVNLLTATESEIRDLPWVSPLVARGIVALRERGGLASVQDLEKVDGIDRRLLDLIAPFVTVERPARAGPPFRASVRLRAVASPATSSYEGLRTYGRLNLERSAWSAGFLLEKDRDESQANDFQAFYLERSWDWGKVTVGEFLLASGHGLVFAGPFGASPSTVSPWRFGRGEFRVAPYTSVEENSALRGIGVVVGGERLGVCLAGSRSALDADIGEAGMVTSIRTTGYHVNGYELAARDALQEDLLGLAARCGWRSLDLRLNLAYAHYDHAFDPEEFTGLAGRHHVLASVDLVLSGDDGMVFAEVASARHGGEAVIGGVSIEQGRTDFLVMGRRYSAHFTSLHGRPFSYYSGLEVGEKGVFTCLTYRPVPNSMLSLGADLRSKASAGRYTMDPSGSEAFLDLEIEARAFAVAVGEKLVRAKEPASGGEDTSEKRTRLRSRLDIRYEPARHLRFRARYENLRAESGVWGSEVRSSSDLVRFDSGLDLGRLVKMEAGVYVYSIGDYAARIYQYEAGLPYYPTLNLLKSDGSRWYIRASVSMDSFGRLTAKAGRTVYDDDADRLEFLFYYSWRN